MQEFIDLRQAVNDDLQDIVNGYQTNGDGLRAFIESMRHPDAGASHAANLKDIEVMYQNLIDGKPIR